MTFISNGLLRRLDLPKYRSTQLRSISHYHHHHHIGRSFATSTINNSTNSLAPDPSADGECEQTGKDFVESAKAEVSMQRFWKTVDIHPSEDGNFHIRLDKRKLVTPSGNQLVIPQSRIALAVLVAREWAEQRKILKQHSLPLTSLVSRSIDGMKDEDRNEIIDSLLNYLDTDTVCFFEEKPQRLVDLQDKHWKPLIDWIDRTYSVKLKVHHDSILFAKQSPATKEALRSVVMQFDQLKLAGFERAVHVTKSFVIALALVEGKLTVDEASDASRVEVLSQIARWGEVEDTHDVDFHEIRMKLGSVTCALI